MVPNSTDKLQASPSTTRSACLYLLVFILLFPGTVVSAYQVCRVPLLMECVLLSGSELLTFFLRLHLKMYEYRTVQTKISWKVAMWVFGAVAVQPVLKVVFDRNPLPCNTANEVEDMLVYSAAVNTCGVLVYEINNTKSHAFIMRYFIKRYFPSQTGQESGSAHDDLQSDQPAALERILSVEGLAPASVGHPESVVPPMVDAAQTANQINGFNIGTSSGTTRSGVEIPRNSFRTKSEVDILDDGYKWHRNGQKYVRNSPYPRKYFRCSTEGCSVKKWVQRDMEDESFVITTYTGMHNHMSPYDTTLLL